jgi:F-type H+-transporting ATPase subunit b
MPNLVVLDSVGETIKKYISENLIPSWSSFVVQLAALVILIVVVLVVAYKPMKKMLAKRADYIENNIRESEIAKAEAERNAQESQEMIIASRKEAADIVANAKSLAIDTQKATVEETQLEVNRMKSQAQEDIERSKIEAKEEIRQEMVSVALAASKEILKREVNEKDNARIVENFIEEIDK